MKIRVYIKNGTKIKHPQYVEQWQEMGILVCIIDTLNDVGSSLMNSGDAHTVHDIEFFHPNKFQYVLARGIEGEWYIEPYWGVEALHSEIQKETVK